MVEWCHCPQGDPTNKVLCLWALFPVFPSFLETLNRQLCCHAVHPMTDLWAVTIQYMFHAAIASCCFCDSLGLCLCLLFICKQFWPPTHLLYLQCQSQVCSVDFTLIIGCSTCCQAPTLSCLVPVMKFIHAVQEQPTVMDFRDHCWIIDYWALPLQLSYFPLLCLCPVLSVAALLLLLSFVALEIELKICLTFVTLESCGTQIQEDI